jgi:copper chaperone NosL
VRYLLKYSVFLSLLLLLSCSETELVETPPPQELSRDAVGYFCQMTVVEHTGPKGQVILADREEPLWFVSVRDTLVFTALPGEPKNISAIYVTDIGRADWDNPEPGTWLDAREAWYVVNSDRAGGMGAPEIVPFGKKEDAEQFISLHGGAVLAFDAIEREELVQPMAP